MSGPFGGDPVLVAGAGVSGLAAATALVDAGARVLLSDDRADALSALPDGCAFAPRCPVIGDCSGDPAPVRRGGRSVSCHPPTAPALPAAARSGAGSR